MAATDGAAADRTTVVGVDGSPCSDAALGWAGAHAEATGSRLVPVTAEVERRSPRSGAAEVLLAEAQGADLLVVGTHGRGPLGRAVAGSVSTACAERSPVPVAVVAADAVWSDRPVVVGFDGSATSAAAVRWGAGLALAAGAALRVVFADVSYIPEPFGMLPDATPPLEPRPDVEVEVAAALAGLDAVPPVAVEVRGGPAVQVLRSASDQGRVLVVGRRAHRWGPGPLLGSISRRCVHRASGVVVVVPPAG